jgi:hypothetical protein
MEIPGGIPRDPEIEQTVAWLLAGVGSGLLVFFVVYLVSRSPVSGFVVYLISTALVYLLRFILPFLWRKGMIIPSRLMNFLWFSRGYIFAILLVIIAAALL